jgi:hypothetical protein
MKYRGWTVNAGDTNTCTVAGATITGYTSELVLNDGTMVMNGTSGSHITITDQSFLQASATTANIDFQYVDITSATFSGLALGAGTTLTVTRLDNCTMTGGSVGLDVALTGQAVTATNCTFVGTGSTWTTADVLVQTGSALQGLNCTYTVVGFESTSGKFTSKDGSGNYTVYGIYASSETPGTGYRGSQCAGTFTLKDADAYDTPFNSSYTLGAACTSITAVTVSASTTLTTSASNYALTGSLDAIITGTLTGNGSAISFRSLTISVTTGVYTATSATTTITGKNGSNDAWVNNNTFTCGTGKVDFTGTGAPYHIHGNNTWYDLEISLVTASTYLFMNGQTQTISNSTKLTGAAGNFITLNSVSGTATWLYTIQAGKTQTHSYLQVTYSDASGGDTADGSNHCYDLNNNNTNWTLLLSGVVVTGPIVPTSTSDTYATHKSKYGQGGWQAVANAAARLAITSNRREPGMSVYEIDTETYWTLTGGIADINWEQVFFGGFPMFRIWSAPQTTMIISATPGNVAGPSVVVPANFLPAGATITRVELLMKYRKVVDDSGSDNNLDGDLNVQVKESVAGSFTTGIGLKSGMALVAGDAESAGDVVVGDVDVKAEVAADNKTYNVQIASAKAVGDYLYLKDVQFGLEFYVAA